MPAKKLQTLTVHAEPQKDFFVTMITRDITTISCVMDLIDNSIDASTRTEAGIKKPQVDLRFSGKSFEIADNCGGMELEVATNYAFHFGRRRGAPPNTSGIGMYGIGMKRAMFKLGRQIHVESMTKKDGFELDIDVDKWIRKPDSDWNFELQTRIRSGAHGTTLRVSRLNSDVAAELGDRYFVSQLMRRIGKVYSRFIENGTVITINDMAVDAYPFNLRLSDSVKPARKKFKVGSVDVTITAGLGEPPPDDTSAEFATTDSQHWGWYVLCNDRVVLGGDKSSKTGWGADNFLSWHPQFNGFIGVVEFKSKKPDDLPWTTTKADVDESSEVLRGAIKEMKQAAKKFTEYTTARKGFLAEARVLEQKAKPQPVRSFQKSQEMKLPVVEKSKIQVVNVSYQVPRTRFTKAARAMGDVTLSGRTVGLKAFDYFCKNEVTE